MSNSKYNINYDEYIIFGEPVYSAFSDKIELEKFAKEGMVFPYKALAQEFKEYYNLMMNEEYFYIKEDLVQMFDFNKHFIQTFIKKDYNFKLILLSRSSRDILRCTNYIKRNNIELIDKEQEEIYNLALKLLEKIDTSNKIYFKKADILAWIMKNFKREVGEELKQIDYKEALEIFNKSLLRNKSIKENYDLKHDMQVTRLIKCKMQQGKFRKYIFYNAGKQRPIIRYLIDEK